MSAIDPTLVPARPPSGPLFALPGATNASVPIRSMCTTGSLPCPSQPSDADLGAYAQCLEERCSGPANELNMAYSAARVPREPGTRLGEFPTSGITPTMRSMIEQAAASVEVCGVERCLAQWTAVSSSICVPLDAPAIVSRGYHLASLPASATTNTTLVRLFQTYQAAVSTHLLPTSDPASIDLARFTATMLGTSNETSSLDKLGVCVPTLPIGSTCDARAWDAQSNLPALGRAVPNFATTGKSSLLPPTSPTSASLGFPIHAVRLPPVQGASTEVTQLTQRSGNTFTSIVCLDGTVSSVAPKLPGAECTTHTECLLGMCVANAQLQSGPQPLAGVSTCRVVNRLAAATNSSAVPPITEPPSNPTSDSSNASDSTLSALASPILWAQLAAIILASVLLLGWSRGGIQFRKRMQARLVRVLARAQPRRSTVVRELACHPADNRMLASYRPRHGRRRRGQRGTRALRVRYLPDGTPQWIEEHLEEDDEPLPRYVPPPMSPPALDGVGTDDRAVASAAAPRRSSLPDVDSELAPLLAPPAAAADVRRSGRRGSASYGGGSAPGAVGSPRISVLLDGPPPPPFGMPMARPASLDSNASRPSSLPLSRRGSVSAGTFEDIDEDEDDEVDGRRGSDDWFGHRQ